MLTILRNIINQVNSEGFNCNLVIGHREVIAQYQADKPLFYFEMPTMTFDSETNDTIYSLKYVLGINSEQNGNETDSTFEQIKSVLIINKLFMYKLRTHQNSEGQQLFIPEGVANIRTFADLQLLQHPTTGIFVELRFKALSNNFCEWQI
jgi:hypothetical protein